MGRRAAFHTLGCKVNYYESEAMAQLLVKAGYEIVDFTQQADVYIINTCSVTNIAERKSRQMLHRAKKKNPEAIVAAVGCYVQVAGDVLDADNAVDLIIPSDSKHDIVYLLEEFIAGRRKKKEMPDRLSTAYEELELETVIDHTRAFVKVQDGCNQFCSYCIIPFARGRVRSRAKENVVMEAARLSAAGVKEIVITGIHLSSYGRDLKNGEGLIDLIEAVHATPGIERIRLGSLEPRIITLDFTKRLKSMDKVCPHFHLSLQSGCEETLKRMNRHYTPEEYLKSCELLRESFDDPAITTDVIVGFPGETDEEFSKSREFLKIAGFYELHVFKFSRRRGTRADLMQDQISEEKKADRSSDLLELEQHMTREYRTRWIGRRTDILLEQPIEIDGETYMTGYTPEYIKCAVKTNHGENAMLKGRIKAFLTPDIMLFEDDQKNTCRKA